jgi:protein Mpv17
MSMSSNFGRNGGFNKGPKSVIRNIFRSPKSGNNKNSGGGLNGGNNNNKPPSGPGPLDASSADDGKEKAEGFLKDLWTSYNNNLESSPILTKALTSLTGFALGDFLAQKFIDKRDELDLQRLARMASFGLLVHGPTGHFFYGWLDNKIKSNGAAAVASKVFIDQVLWNPIFGTLFFGYMGAAEGLGLSAIKTRIENNLWSSVKGSWTVWPVAHAINFRYIPTSQRLLYINSIQIGYNMFLSVLGQRANSTGDKVAHKIEKGAKKVKSKASRRI